MSFVDSFAASIATMEGFYKPGTPAARNHNPGNITDTSGKLKVNPDDATGWADLYDYLNRHFAQFGDLTIYQFFDGGNGYPGYASSKDPRNDPYNYASYTVGRVNADERTNFTINTTIAEALAATSASPDEAMPPAASPDMTIAAATPFNVPLPVVMLLFGLLVLSGSTNRRNA